jgi:DNA-binding NtrC family response regulator
MSDPSQTLVNPTPPPYEALARVRVKVVRGPDLGQSITGLTGRRLTVGVAPGNDLCLRDPTVSRFHLELLLGRDGVTVKDLGSLNGVLIGGLRARDVVIPLNVQVQLGATVISVEDAGEEAAPVEGLAPEVPGLVGVSRAMGEVARSIRQLAGADISVLIQGETGTGKELVATALHAASARAHGPFVVVDCGSLSPTGIASELFGHEQGAFAGAERPRQGAFGRAQGGTIFLDEIGELPLQVQPALLGVLQRRRFRPVGGEHDVSVDVRVVAATNRDLRSEVNGGAFRADLYFRLAVGRIVLPPLRERPEDIEPLVRHFVAEATGREGHLPFDEATFDTLRRQHWGGNVRELRNVVESALAVGELQLDGQGAGAGPRPPSPSQYSDEAGEVLAYREARARAIGAFERDYFTNLITRCGGNASEAARRGQIDRPYLLSILRRLGLR